MPHADPRELRRIAFVTRRFLELEGLIPATFGALLLFGMFSTHVVGGPVRLFDVLQPLLLPMTLMGVFTPFLQASYRRSFGDVVSTWQQKLLGSLPTMLIMAGAIMDMEVELGTSRSRPSFAAVALTAYSITVMIRDWPWRPHQLIAATAGVAGALVTAAIPAAADRWGADPARAEAYLLAYVLIGLGMAATGLCDHHLLARSLKTSDPPVTRARGARATAVKRVYASTALIAATAIPLSQGDNWLPAFPLTLMIAFLLAMMFVSGMNALQAVRNLGQRPPQRVETGVILDFSGDELVAFALFAIAAAAQFVLMRAQAPLVFGITIAAAAAWLAIAAPQRRRWYGLTAIATGVALISVVALPPARGFLALLFAGGIASLLDAGADIWTTWRSDIDHAHTI